VETAQPYTTGRATHRYPRVWATPRIRRTGKRRGGEPLLAGLLSSNLSEQFALSDVDQVLPFEPSSSHMHQTAATELQTV